MKNFRRSLTYLRPYRWRIAWGVLCVVLLATLWFGGLGMMLPGAKILISEEGLHGWAYYSQAQDRLKAKLVRQEAEAGRTVLHVAGLEEDSPAAQAGIKAGQWIVAARPARAASQPGTAADSQPAMDIGEVVPADELAERIAAVKPGQEIELEVADVRGSAVGVEPRRRVTVRTSDRPDYRYELLGWVANHVRRPASYADRFGLFMQFLIVFLVLTYLRGVFEFFQEYLVSTAVWRGIMDLRCENYTQVLRAPVMYFVTRGVNDTISRFIQDTNELARAQATLFGKTLAEPAKALAGLVLALLLSWKLTLLALVAGPPSYLVIRKLGKKIHRASRKALESLSSLLAVLEETLTGIRVVKAYTMEGAERKRFFQVNRGLIKQQYRMERIDAATGPLIESLGLTFGMVAAGGAAWMVFNPAGTDSMDPIKFLTWMGTLFALFDPVRKLSKVSNRFQQGEAAAKRVFELTDLEPERSAPDAPMLPRHSHSIRFHHISFRYPGAAESALTDVSLTVPAGTTCAIVGPNGSGKTTLVSLLPRLLEPSAGHIYVDEHDISKVSLRSLRRQIGLVTQETVLFHATIAENIAYGLRRPRREDVLAAAQRAYVDEFVRELPDGYETMVGEHGVTLSGGQRQRIAIARAILRDPAILIFDEAMSQVDADSERRIQQAMEEFTRGRTTFVVAHRFATVLSADVIVVLTGGMVVDRGTHGDLLSRCELYRHLYTTQFADTSRHHGATRTS